MQRHGHDHPSPSRARGGDLLALLLAIPFVAAACTTAAGETPAPAITVEPGATSASATADASAAAEASVEAAGSWLDLELTDAQTGEAFTLASLAGGVVALEPMAVWCTNCKAQQDNVKKAYAEIEASGVTYISLGIDPGESAEALARYADRRGYPWVFVQSSTELSRALVDEFGPQILSAPSTPLIVLDAEGGLAAQEFGFHGRDALLGILGEAAS